MLERLVWTFGATWLIGVTGAFVTRGVLHVPADSTPALLSASVWLVGGAGYLLLGGLALGLETLGTRPTRTGDRARR